MTRTLILGAGLLLVCVPLVSAQRTWVVDAASGPGTDFTNLPPALQVAVDGDTILLRTGVYDGGIISRAIHLLGEGSPTIQAGTSGSFVEFGLFVSNLPAGSTFTMRGIDFTRAAGNPFFVKGIEFGACAGHVVLTDLDVDVAPTGTQSGAGVGLTVRACSDVSVIDCRFSAGMISEGSTVHLRSCDFQGQNGVPGRFSVVRAAVAGLACSDSDLSICGGSFVGGYGADSFFQHGMPDAPALHTLRSTVRIANGPGTSFSAGMGTSTLVTAIVGLEGTTDLEPSLTFNTTPGVSGTTTYTFRIVPAMHVTPTAIGSILPIVLYAEPSEPYLLYVSLLTSPVPLGSLGVLWLDPLAFLSLGGGFTDHLGQATLSIPIPLDPTLQGGLTRVQAVRGMGTNVTLSDPCVAVLH